MDNKWAEDMKKDLPGMIDTLKNMANRIKQTNESMESKNISHNGDNFFKSLTADGKVIVQFATIEKAREYYMTLFTEKPKVGFIKYIINYFK
jgi:hypothetical protein